MNITSCGVIILKDDTILLGHATNQTHWDIPKGRMEDGETYLEAVLRETEEEIGHKLNPEDLKFIGDGSYRSTKDLALFLYCGEPIDISTCFCDSTFIEESDNREYPEFDDFKYVKLSDLDQYLRPNLIRSIKEIYSKGTGYEL